MLLPAANLNPVCAVSNTIEHTPLVVELLAQLIEVRDLQAGAQANRSRVGREFAEQEAQ